MTDHYAVSKFVPKLWNTTIIFLKNIRDCVKLQLSISNIYLMKICIVLYVIISPKCNTKIRDTVAGGSVLAHGAQPPAMSRFFLSCSECLESETSFHSLYTWLGDVFVCLMSSLLLVHNAAIY